jgi:hypothetical protein
MSKKVKKKARLRCYLAGPMRGIPKFNFPAFDKAARTLRKKGWVVFNPADKDRQKYGRKINDSKTGDLDEATKKHGFSLREALCADLMFICLHANAVAMLPGWERSAGANAEHSTAVALGLRIIYL